MNTIDQVTDWEMLARFAHAFRNLSDALMENIAMRRPQATALSKLYIEDGVTQSEIAQQIGIRNATVTDMLQRMEEAGLVRRQRDPEDNRLVRVYLTEAGRCKERSIAHQFCEIERAIFADFADDERVIFRQLMQRATNNMISNR